MSVIANANRGKSTRPYRADQFIPKWDPEAPQAAKPVMDGEEMLRAVKRMHRRMAGERARESADGDHQ